MSTMRLSVEEMAYVLGVLQGNTQAATFLKSVIGEREPKEIEGRLIAASHSLIAHGYLSLDGEQLKLNEEFQTHFLRLVGSNFSIRMSKTSRGQEDIVSYFFSRDHIAESRIENAVVCCLETIENMDSFLNRVRIFWEISPDEQKERLHQVTVIPADILDPVRKDAEAGNKGRALELLVSKGVNKSIGQQLVDDMASANWRGSILRMKPDGDVVFTDRGFLLLKGREQLWLFAIEKSIPEIRIFPGNYQTFQELLLDLIT